MLEKIARSEPIPIRVWKYLIVTFINRQIYSIKPSLLEVNFFLEVI